MKKKTLKAEQLPSGNWRVRVYIGEVNGKKKWQSVTASSYQEVMKLAAEYEGQKTEALTVEKACERFLEARKTELSPSTMRGYYGTLNTYIKPDPISRMKLEKVTTPVLQSWISRMEVSKKSKKNHYGFLLTVLRYHDIDRMFKVRIAQAEEKELYTPTMQEVNIVMQHADEELRRAIALACFGLRRGEICALTAKDIDRKNCTVNVNKAYAKTPENTFILKTPKTKKSKRIVPVSQSVIDLLPEEGPIISCSPDCITNRFIKTVKRSGVTPFRFHDLRSFFASISLSSAIGAGSRTVQDLGGWETDRVLKSHYDRAIPDQEKKDREAIILYLSNNLKTKQG